MVIGNCEGVWVLKSQKVSWGLLTRRGYPSKRVTLAFTHFLFFFFVMLQGSQGYPGYVGYPICVLASYPGWQVNVFASKHSR